MLYRLRFLVVFTLIFIQAKGQTLVSANEKFSAGNFYGALEEYNLLSKSTPADPDLNYQIGICYLKTNINKSKAIAPLELVLKSGKHLPDVYFYLGKAYHLNFKFDEAIEMFTQFKNKSKKYTNLLYEAEKNIQYCYNGKELTKFPLNVSFTNLGTSINSSFADYAPFISNNESFLIYNTRRNDGSSLSADGRYLSNVYISNEQKGEWQPAVSIGDHINTQNRNEEIVGLSADGKTMVFHFSNLDFGDLFIGPKEDQLFFPPQLLNDHINSAYGEISSAISPDGKTLYLVSDRPGGHGGLDIYRSMKLSNGEWSEAFNLGPEVNTKGDENFPTLSADGKTLYFSSKEHTSIGGYDIFKIIWDDEQNKWTGLRNIGFPINTPDDDLSLCMSDNGRYGYISALRPEGLGDLDIYRVTINDVEPELTLIKGYIVSEDGNQISDKINISITDKKNNKLFGNYVANPSSGKFVAILPPGKYEFSVNCQGFNSYFEEISILDKASYKTVLIKDMVFLKR